MASRVMVEIKILIVGSREFVEKIQEKYSTILLNLGKKCLFLSLILKTFEE